jgi:hypothetical protein
VTNDGDALAASGADGGVDRVRGVKTKAMAWQNPRQFPTAKMAHGWRLCAGEVVCAGLHDSYMKNQEMATLPGDWECQGGHGGEIGGVEVV